MTKAGIAPETFTKSREYSGSKASRQLSYNDSDEKKGQEILADHETINTDGVRSLFVKKTFEEMNKILANKANNDNVLRHHYTPDHHSPESLARQIIVKVKSHLKELLQCANAAETEARADAVAKAQHLKKKDLPAPDNVPVGTTFRKKFDSLGEFEGVVVAIPSATVPLYQVEYEDGGSESLTQASLVALLGSKKPANPTAPHDALDSEFLKSMEQSVQEARNEAFSQAFRAIISGHRNC